MSPIPRRSTMPHAVDADWPNRAFSRQIEAGGLSWHVQIAGRGPVLLLVHGTAASTHSWRDLIVPLAEHFTVVAPDLPSHGFTGSPGSGGMSITGMSRLIAALLQALGLSPALCAGHSAGAAILMQMTLDRQIQPSGIVSLNGALLPFAGPAGHVFPALARLIFLNALTPRIFAAVATRGLVGSLLADTGSRLDARGIELYARLFGRSRHVSGALGMMANWDLHGLERDLARIETPILLIAGQMDKAVPLERTQLAAKLIRHCNLEVVPGAGHLVHEEQPEAMARRILSFAREVGLAVDTTRSDLPLKGSMS